MMNPGRSPVKDVCRNDSETVIQKSMERQEEQEENEVAEINDIISIERVEEKQDENDIIIINAEKNSTTELCDEYTDFTLSQTDDDIEVLGVKLAMNPNRDLRNARAFQNEIIFINSIDESANEDVISRNRSSFSTKNARDYWRRTTKKSADWRRIAVRHHLEDSRCIQRVSSSPIRKATSHKSENISLDRYRQLMVQCGYVKPLNFDTRVDRKSKKNDAKDLLIEAKNAIAGINSSKFATPFLSQDSSVISENPTTFSSFTSEYKISKPITEILSKIENLNIDVSTKDRYQSVYEATKRKEDALQEELRLRQEHRTQTKGDAQEKVRQRLALQGIVIRSKLGEKKEEFMPLPAAADQLIEKAWTNIAQSNEQFVEAFGIQIVRRDLQTLFGLNWLNDNIINFYLQLICERSTSENTYPRVYAFNTFFYTNIVDKGYASVKRWTRKVDIFSYSIILVPIHLGMHWCMSVIDIDEKKINFYDSLYNDNEKVLSELSGYLNSESMDKKKTKFDFTGWNIVQLTEIPRQRNGSDCGVFSCQFGEWASRRKIPEFSQKHMPYYRKRMVHEIVTKRLLATI
uniref:ULP_PROTEASE domain-containing protein n=2 Tax=Caenorhabditis japonica TaxID=281687 RepID=A0A8R1HKN2_CAEJA